MILSKSVLQCDSEDSSCRGGKSSKVMSCQNVFSNLVNVDTGVHEQIVSVFKNGTIFQKYPCHTLPLSLSECGLPEIQIVSKVMWTKLGKVITLLDLPPGQEESCVPDRTGIPPIMSPRTRERK